MNKEEIDNFIRLTFSQDDDDFVLATNMIRNSSNITPKEVLAVWNLVEDQIINHRDYTGISKIKIMLIILSAKIFEILSNDDSTKKNARAVAFNLLEASEAKIGWM